MGAIRLLHLQTLTLLGAFLLQPCEGTQRPLTTKPMTALPAGVIEYRIVNPPSTCYCKLNCVRNLSCTAVSLNMDGGSVTCSFSNVGIDLASLTFSTSDHTFIHNVSQPTQESVSSVGTASSSTISSSTTSSPATPSSTASSSTTSSPTASSSTSSSPTTSSSTTSSSTTSSSTTSSPTTSSSSSSSPTTSSPSTSSSTSSSPTTSSSTTSSSTTSSPTTSSSTTSVSTTTATDTSTSTSTTVTSTSTTSSSSTTSSTSTTPTTSTSTTSRTTTTTPVNYCDWIWHPFNGSCYYQFGAGNYGNDETWQNASTACGKYNNYLVKISSAELLAFIRGK
ncbi:uncharacterized protein DDB_G0271670-like [Macrobrachium nipponense]|uniref:uncharacterized protein DDB_G0271670-like n=1 Tax=Macrobrachium nipponense TaxID=159736 RepID=UPI0030C7C4EE